MNCQSALDAMLVAEPFELDARSLTPLGQHLRECSRCGRVATQLVQDTRLLANAMHAQPVQRPARRAVPPLIPALALGAIVLAVILRSGTERSPVARPVVVQQAVVVTPPASFTAPNVSIAALKMTRSAEPRAFARAVAMAPVRLDTPSVESPSLPVESNTVTVTPPAGTRATVMHTSNPKLVVVWLH